MAMGAPRMRHANFCSQVAIKRKSYDFLGRAHDSRLRRSADPLLSRSRRRKRSSSTAPLPLPWP
eukprot:scaffold171749_cov30-Tisochrysis_lutea.AAC.1